jgi:transglutaminase-like putative cysteine protease
MLNSWQKLPRESRDTLFLLTVVGWIILQQASNLPSWTLVLAAGSLGWRGWLAWRSKPLPSRVWLLVLLIAAVAGTVITHRTILGRDAGVTLVVLLLALKTLELRARRDAFVIFFLGFFTMLTNFFFSQSLLTAASMLLALLGLLTTVINAHLPVGKPSLASSAGLALRLAAGGAPIMVVLFLLFPRVTPLWGLPSDALSGRSGLSSRMQIGNISSLALDDDIAMRVRFLGQDNQAPPNEQLYFRGPVLSNFDGREWSPAPEPARGALPSDELKTTGASIDYEVTLEPNNQNWLLTLELTPQAPFAPALQAYQGGQWQWRSQRLVTELTRYRARAYPQYRYGGNARVPDLQRDIDLPPGFNPRTLQLAMDMRRTPELAHAGALTLSNAVLKRLSEGGYTYTLDPGVYGQHTADEFWFDRKEGFCEHIASAYVILMRALDVPARIVTGYQGGERNGVDDYWVVRQSDAHAWAEIWDDSTGWVRIDPTGAISPGRVGAHRRLAPPKGVLGTALANVSPDLLLQLRAGWEALNNRWNQWVLNYTQTRQMNLLKDIGFEAPDWEDLALLMALLLAAAGTAGAAWSYWEKRRQDPWLRLLHAAQGSLSARGLTIPATTPPRTLAHNALTTWGESARPLHDWLLELEACRYGPQAITAPRDQLFSLKQRWRKLRLPRPADSGQRKRANVHPQ